MKFILVLVNSFALADVPSLLEVRRLLAQGIRDPNEIWVTTRAEKLIEANRSIETAHSLILIFSAIASTRTFHLGFGRRATAQRDFCKNNSKYIREIIVEDFKSNWALRWKMEAEFFEIGFVGNPSVFITPFWNFEKVCPLLVDDVFEICRIVVMQRVFKNIFLSSDRKTRSYGISVSVENVLDDSISVFSGRKFLDLWDRQKVGRLNIRDFPGGFAGWVAAVVRSLREQDVLVQTEEGTGIFTINKLREISQEYLIFLGKLMALCLIEGTYLGLDLTLGIFKLFLDESATSEELETEFPSVFKYLEEIDLENSEIFFGNDLISGGNELRVTGENILRYDRLMANWKLVKSMKKQFSSIKKGFVRILRLDKNERIRDFLPELLIAEEMQKIICGPSTDSAEVNITFDWTRWGYDEWSDLERKVFMDRMQNFLVHLRIIGLRDEFLRMISGNRWMDGKPIIAALRFELENPDSQIPLIIQREGRISVPMYSTDQIFVEKMMQLL